MQIEIIRQQQHLEALTDEWNALLLNNASHVPFLRSEFLNIWWETRGGQEWPQAELYLATARGPEAELLGIAPLFYDRNREGEPALMLLGSIEISDYLDLITSPENLPAFVENLFEYLSSRDAPAWQVLDFYNIPESSPTLVALQKAAEKRGWYYFQEFLQNCPLIALPEDWDSYLGSLDKKQRHEIRRKMRRAAENEREVRWYIVSDESTLDDEIEAFFKLMVYDLEKEKFLTSAMREQMRKTMQTLFKQGFLQLAFIEVGGEKAAAYLNIDFDNRIWVYNSGYNPNFRELSLGWVLLGHLIQWSINNHRRIFDFMRGDEDYKYRFGATNSRIVRAMIRC